jgi:hypothetical protein
MLVKLESTPKDAFKHLIGQLNLALAGRRELAAPILMLGA